MEHCDALIVGGGPGGSTAAWKLKRAGLDVVVLDKKTFPRDKVCAGWITPQVVDALELDLDDYRTGRVLQPFTGFRTACLGQNGIETAYGEPVSYGIRRCEFDHYLLQRSGARLNLGAALQSLRRENSEWVINESLRAPLLIGAGGHFCPVARHLGARLGGAESVVAAQEIEFAMNEHQLQECRVAEQTPELFFCADLKGYGWAVRKGNYLNIGLGREDNHKLSAHVEAFCAFLKRQGRIPQDVPDHFNGHAYLLYAHTPRKIIADGALLIGDAAGLAYPQSGEGILPAIESAILAADVILAAHGDYRRGKLAPYEEKLAARFGERKTQAMPGVVIEKLKQAIGRRLLATRWFSRHVVLDRWFLHAGLPPLQSGQS
ncbi:MAG: NAD(P)/FAD-dependent oxidoreductase [Gammaproteobacteria bacterium]|nr:NAD(P)/FAD-dependent oxidoreductase [Gammaproteobacteria bacterium]